MISFAKFNSIVITVVILFILLFSFIRTQREKEYEKIFEEREKEWVESFHKNQLVLDQLSNYTNELKRLSDEGFGGRTLLPENKLVFREYEASDTHAIVTMIGGISATNSYWMSALAMIQSLREVKTRVPNIVVMARENTYLPEFAKEAFARLNATLVTIETLQTRKLNVKIPGTWAEAFDKLNVWTMTQFTKVLFLDADTIIAQNIDHLLLEDELTAPYTPTNCQCNRDFRQTPEFFTISSGFFVCKPSLETFEYMLQLASGPSPDPEDLDQFGGTWHWGDQEMIRVVFHQLSKKWNFLDWEYDLPVGMCSCPQRRTRPIYSYHFVCNFPVTKPWVDPFPTLFDTKHQIPACVIEIYLLWFRCLGKALSSPLSGLGVKTEEIPARLTFDPENRVLWH